MPCKPQTFTGIDAAKYARLVERAKAAGIDISGSCVEAKGCTFAWIYHPAVDTLVVQCMKKPFYASCAAVEKRVSELIEQ